MNQDAMPAHSQSLSLNLNLNLNLSLTRRRDASGHCPMGPGRLGRQATARARVPADQRGDGARPELARATPRRRG